MVTIEATPGREPVQIVEIEQPFCTLTHGTAPCTATETGDAKCFNTRSSCNDTANFDKGSLSLYFSRGNIADRLDGPDFIYPFLSSVSTTPTKINLAGMNPNAKGLGTRALCKIVFIDAPNSDRVVDPYISDRTYSGLDRSSFWPKWMARNKYRAGTKINIYDGYAGQALAAMRKRVYFLEKITGPDASGRIVFNGVDILSRLEGRKATAPKISTGELYADITATDTSFEVTDAVLADYSASGTLNIQTEVMTYTSTATSTNGITFSGVTRGTDNSTAASHSAGGVVQECLRVTNQVANDVVEDLLLNYAGVDAAWLDTANWQIEADSYLLTYTVTTLITKPTAVDTLISELQQQVLFYLWWDEVAALVKMKAIRGVTEDPPTLTDENHIIAGSFSVTEMPKMRASQVWVSYDQIDRTKAVKDDHNWQSVKVIVDLSSEGSDKYDEKSAKKIYGRWISTSALALSTASKLSVRYVDVPRQCVFSLDAKDRDRFGVGDQAKISHYSLIDDNGENDVRTWTITSTEEIIQGEVIRFTAEDTTLYGKVYLIQADGAADYDPATAAFSGAYIGDNSGLLSDGTDCARIS